MGCGLLPRKLAVAPLLAWGPRFFGLFFGLSSKIDLILFTNRARIRVARDCEWHLKPGFISLVSGTGKCPFCCHF